MFERIGDYVRQYGDKVGVVIRAVNTGEQLQINGDRPFASASIIKVPIMWEFCRRASAGEIDPDEMFTLHDCHKVGSSVYDSGILREMHDGIQLTYRDILRLMIIISDDTATNIMLDLLGMDQINETMRNLGLKNTILRRRMMEYDKVARGIDNQTSAADMDRLLDRILQKQDLEPAVHNIMLDTLAKQQINTAIPAFLSPALRIAHKTGSILDYGLEHDVGIIYNMQNEPVVAVSVMSQHLENNRNVIAQIAKMAYEEVSQ